MGYYNARIDMMDDNGTMESVTIDSYLRDIKVGYIKMDIEDSERNALAGGMEAIRRDRPILAISM